MQDVLVGIVALFATLFGAVLAPLTGLGYLVTSPLRVEAPAQPGDADNLSAADKALNSVADALGLGAGECPAPTADTQDGPVLDGGVVEVHHGPFGTFTGDAVPCKPLSFNNLSS